jgi:hypothetical protein
VPERSRPLVEDGNLSPDVYAGLDPKRTYGIQWYNGHKTETVPGPGGRNKNIQVDRPRSEWVAVPVPDAGIPLEWVEKARKSIRSNVRPSDAGRRAWPLKGFAYGPWGARLVPHALVKGGKDKPRFYYVCRWHRARKGGCEYAKYYKAEKTEDRVSAFVLNLIRNPETLREQVEAEAAREKAAMRDTRKQVAALASRLAEADAERDRYNRLYARGTLSDDEYETYTAEIDERRKAAEEELTRLEDARRYVEYLDELPRLVDDYLRELPQMIDELPRIREYVPDENRTPVYVSTPTERSYKIERVVSGTYRKRTPQELEELHREAERERAGRYQRPTKCSISRSWPTPTGPSKSTGPEEVVNYRLYLGEGDSEVEQPHILLWPVQPLGDTSGEEDAPEAVAGAPRHERRVVPAEEEAEIRLEKIRGHEGSLPARQSSVRGP